MMMGNQQVRDLHHHSRRQIQRRLQEFSDPADENNRLIVPVLQRQSLPAGVDQTRGFEFGAIHAIDQLRSGSQHVQFDPLQFVVGRRRPE